MRVEFAVVAFLAGAFGLSACTQLTMSGDATMKAAATDGNGSFDAVIQRHGAELIATGREVFRYETFGSEGFWGGTLQLHRAILGANQGGVGPGLTPKDALGAGLKVDAAKLPDSVVEAIKGGTVSLDSPETTVALLRLDAVIGVKAFFDQSGVMQSVGIRCSLCHSTVDDSFAPGIGQRLDGWPNRDLNVGAIVSLAPNLKAVAAVLSVDEKELRQVLAAWGPGKYDAQLNIDRKGFRPDGKSGATVIPAAFGLAGVSVHTYTGWGSIPYWNAYVAKIQMGGRGTFYDPRLARAGTRFLVQPKQQETDRITSQLAALHVYQLTIPAPKPPQDSYDTAAAERGKALFAGKARCTECHVPPLYTEPGWPMHHGEEIGIDSFQSDRSPERGYRTTPLAGLFTRMKGGFYHDGRFATLPDVVKHYEQALNFRLQEDEARDLVEYLKSL